MKKLIVLLFCASSASMAASGFLLGVDYSEWIPGYVRQIATDGAGFLYLLTATPGAPSTITKLTPDGKTIVWQNQPGVAALAMTVDPNGGVYITSLTGAGNAQSFQLTRLNSAGQGSAWTWDSGIPYSFFLALAADNSGRVYLAYGDATGNAGELSRVNAAGTALDYTTDIAGWPGSVAVDSRGNAYVTGIVDAIPFKIDFLTQVAVDGTVGFSVPVAGLQGAAQMALNGNGEVAVADFYGDLRWYDATGTLISSQTFPPGGLNAAQHGGPLLDGAGNTYVGIEASGLFPVHNSLAPCGTYPDLLGVIAPDGSILQTTYIAGTIGGGPLLAMGANSDIFVVDSAGADFKPTQTGPFIAGAPAGGLLLHLTPNASAAVLPLACVGNAASLQPGPVAPGEIVTLTGSGLGPQQGVQTQASLSSPFPATVQGVQVTFDGTPAPLLWVQDGQINAIVPWALTVGGTTQACVVVSGARTNCLSLPVAQTSPAVFEVSGVYAAALNQDGTVNSATNPAAPGSIVSVFATGLGPINPAQADGSLVTLPLPVNVLPTAVVLYYYYQAPGIPTRVPLDVTYAGPAPYLVAGVSQINFKVQTSGVPFPYNDDSYCLETGPETCFALYVRLGP